MWNQQQSTFSTECGSNTVRNMTVNLQSQIDEENEIEDHCNHEECQVIHEASQTDNDDFDLITSNNDLTVTNNDLRLSNSKLSARSVRYDPKKENDIFKEIQELRPVPNYKCEYTTMMALVQTKNSKIPALELRQDKSAEKVSGIPLHKSKGNCDMAILNSAEKSLALKQFVNQRYKSNEVLCNTFSPNRSMSHTRRPNSTVLNMKRRRNFTSAENVLKSNGGRSSSSLSKLNGSKMQQSLGQNTLDQKHSDDTALGDNEQVTSQKPSEALLLTNSDVIESDSESESGKSNTTPGDNEDCFSDSSDIVMLFSRHNLIGDSNKK